MNNFILQQRFILEAYNIFKKETSWISHIGLESFCYIVENEPAVLKEILMCYGTNEPREALKLVAALKPSNQFFNAFENASPKNKRIFGDIEIVVNPSDCRLVIDTLAFNGFENIANILTINAVYQVLHFQPWILAEIKNNNFKTQQQSIIFTDWCLDFLLGDKADEKTPDEIIFLLEEEIKDNYKNILLVN